jgi:hypothetical protein
MQRRSLIALVVAAVLGLIALTGLALVVGGDDRRAGALGDEAGSLRWRVRMDGQWMAELSSLRGCSVRRAVRQQQVGPATDKSVGARRLEACELTFAWAEKPLRDWIKAMLQGQQQRKLVELYAVNLADRAQHVKLELEQTLIKKVVFPQLVKENTPGAAYELSLVLQPEQILRTDPASGLASNWSPPRAPTRNNFRLSFQGQIMQSATGMGPVAVTQELSEQADPTGAAGDVTYAMGGLVLDDLTLTTQRTPIINLEQWYRTFVIEGQNDESQEKTIQLEQLDPQTNAIIFTLSLSGVGVYGASDNQGAGTRAYTLYAEGVAYSEPTP